MNLKQPREKVKLNSHQIPYSPVSSIPGRTRHVFRFDLGNRLSICDLPGYGAASAPKEVQDTWNQLVDTFLERASIKRALILVSACNGISALDEGVMTMLNDKGITVQIVLTKVDLMSRGRLHDVVAQSVAHILRSPRERFFPYIHAISAHNDLGMNELRLDLAALARDLEPIC